MLELRDNAYVINYSNPKTINQEYTWEEFKQVEESTDLEVIKHLTKAINNRKQSIYMDNFNDKQDIIILEFSLYKGLLETRVLAIKKHELPESLTLDIFRELLSDNNLDSLYFRSFIERFKLIPVETKNESNGFNTFIHSETFEILGV